MIPSLPPASRWRPWTRPRLQHALRHVLAGWETAAAAWSQPHRLHIAPEPGCASRFDLDIEHQRDWHAMFDTPLPGESAVVHPLHYSHATALQLQARLLQSMGVHPFRCAHVRHRARHPLGTAAYAATRQMRLHATVQHAVGVSGDSAFIGLRTTVSNGATQCVLVADDGFLVHSLPTADVAAAEINTRLARELQSLPDRPCNLRADMTGAICGTIHVPARLRQMYAQVSGAPNTFVLSDGRSRWLSREKPCQTMTVRELIVRRLADAGLPLDRLSMQFTRPVYPGQTLQLVMAQARFELARSSGELVALGHVSE